MRAAHSVSAAAVETDKPTTQAAGKVAVLAVTSEFTGCCSDSWLWSVTAVEAPVCVVTGGARGIGRAIAEMLGATGAKVQTKLHFRSGSMAGLGLGNPCCAT